MATIFNLSVGHFSPDRDAQLVAGDLPAVPVVHNSAPAYAFDDTDEMAVVSSRMVVPSQYNASGMTADVFVYMASDVTNDIAVDVFVEAITPSTDTLDLEAATSWATANSGTISLSGTTAGDLLKISITLTNLDSAAVGDYIRFGARRDCDSANDDAVGDMYFAGMEIRDSA